MPLALRPAAWATSRKAWPARLRVLRVCRRKTLPPELSCRGASPNHAQKAFSLGYFRISKPISARMVCAVLACRPGIANKSTPVSCYRQLCASYASAFLLEEGPTAVRSSGGSASDHTGLITWKGCAISASHSRSWRAGYLDRRAHRPKSRRSRYPSRRRAD
jgi:hypothetical protein